MNKLLIPVALLFFAAIAAIIFFSVTEKIACRERGGVYLNQTGCVKLEIIP